jgi:hypothetical protein
MILLTTSLFIEEIFSKNLIVRISIVGDACNRSHLRDPDRRILTIYGPPKVRETLPQRTSQETVAYTCNTFCLGGIGRRIPV